MVKVNEAETEAKISSLCTGRRQKREDLLDQTAKEKLQMSSLTRTNQATGEKGRCECVQHHWKFTWLANDEGTCRFTSLGTGFD
jgi:hypothetical protein